MSARGTSLSGVCSAPDIYLRPLALNGHLNLGRWTEQRR